MKKNRIRYKKLFFVILLLLAVGAAVVYGTLAFLAWWSAPDAPQQPGKAGTPEYALFIGTSAEGEARADSLILTAVNSQQQSLHVISLPGSTRISASGEPLLLLRDAYSAGGAERTVSAVENLLHIRIGRYAVFDRSGFSALLDHFGGVDLYVEKNMYHEDREGLPDISLRQGVQPLEGENAYGYLRYIDTDEGEIGRIQREERFFKAFLMQSRAHFRLYNWGLVRYYWQPPDTNITSDEAAGTVYTVLGFPPENLHFAILPGEIRTYDNQRVWEINPIEIQKVVGLTIDQ